jgi:prolyl 4-hydroxylase
MEFFGVHHDMGDLAEDGSVAVPPRSPFSKRRLVTLFCYLNDLDAETQGGATRFPKANSLAVQPKRGRAVLFCNVTEGGLADDRTIHEGRPVVEGVKYGLNIWICED